LSGEDAVLIDAIGVQRPDDVESGNHKEQSHSQGSKAIRAPRFGHRVIFEEASQVRHEQQASAWLPCVSVKNAREEALLFLKKAAKNACPRGAC
jgi:hypothetical protein